MPYETLDNLPQDIQGSMPEYAQRVFMTAYNSAESDGMSHEGATQVAWDTVKHEYVQDENGQWHRTEPRIGSNYPLASQPQS
ncbi:MAG: ChaB family protein [Synechococcales bacterium]|nr:ChaB family protein [Synechococcales bacterium]